MNQQKTIERNDNVSFLINCEDHTLVQPKVNKENFLIFVRQYKFAFFHRTNALLQIKTRSHYAISYTQNLSKSLIRKLSFWFQHNSTKSYDTNGIVYWP